MTWVLGLFSWFGFLSASRTDHFVDLSQISPFENIVVDFNHAVMSPIKRLKQLSKGSWWTCTNSLFFCLCDVSCVILHHAHRTSFTSCRLFNPLRHSPWWNFSNCSWLQHICSYFTALWCPLWCVSSEINLDWICRSRSSNLESKICKVSKYISWYIFYNNNRITAAGLLYLTKPKTIKHCHYLKWNKCYLKYINEQLLVAKGVQHDKN